VLLDDEPDDVLPDDELPDEPDDVPLSEDLPEDLPSDDLVSEPPLLAVGAVLDDEPRLSVR
jgi:hypothetical protein